MAQANALQATLDRSSVPLGQTVTLSLHIQGGGGSMSSPDLDALQRDFDVLGTSQSSSFSIVNGTASSDLTLGVVLRPKHQGMLQIPSLNVAGGQSTPLQLEVTAPDANRAVAQRKDVFLETKVQPDQGYVGQQLTYTVRLYFDVSLTRGAIDTPQNSAVQISPTGGDLNYNAERGGREYHVIERRYTLVPQHAGHIDLPALKFQGEAVDPNDPNSFFGASTPISASAPATSIEVRETPADWGGTAWLPARQLTLTLDGLPGPKDTLKVGQPLNVTMKLQATGLSGDALPALSLPALDGATVYPDKPVVDSHNDGQWITGRRQQAFAIVPERAGTLAIPATTVKWWNVLTDRAEVAQIPAHTLTILPATGSATTAPVSPASAAPVTQTSTPVSAPVVTSAQRTLPWRDIAIGSVALWLLSLLGWALWRHYRRRGSALNATGAHTSVRKLQQAFLEAARGSDSALQIRSLLAWARAERPLIQHLGELASLLDDGSQREAIAALQQRRYAGASPSADKDTLPAEAFKDGFIWRREDGSSKGGDLPPLYPFKLH